MMIVSEQYILSFLFFENYQRQRWQPIILSSDGSRSHCQHIEQALCGLMDLMRGAPTNQDAPPII